MRGRSPDQQRGKYLTVRADTDAIVYAIGVVLPHGVINTLELKCTRDGEITAAIVIPPIRKRWETR